MWLMKPRVTSCKLWVASYIWIANYEWFLLELQAMNYELNFKTASYWKACELSSETTS